MFATRRGHGLPWCVRVFLESFDEVDGVLSRQVRILHGAHNRHIIHSVPTKEYLRGDIATVPIHLGTQLTSPGVSILRPHRGSRTCRMLW
jgi:hypothetical protein